MPSSTNARDGTVDFSSGVNSVAVTTLASEQNPGGLHRNESAWIINATCRDGGITPRGGWVKIGKVSGPEGLFQGKGMYNPFNAFPYELWLLSGHVLKVDPDGTVTDLSEQFGLFMPATEPHAYFEQAEEFMVIQAGDNQTLPLIWDGVTLRRSNGITGNISQPTQVAYTFTTTSVANLRKVPSVGSTVTLDITTMYGGAVLDEGVLTGAGVTFGTFRVTAFAAVAPFTITLETISSDKVGAIIPNATDYQFALTAIPAPVPINEIPAAGPMEYYMGRLWYAIGRTVSAGDIVFGPSGTAAYDFRDSVLKVTENPLALTGDGFSVASGEGNIRALKAGGAIDAAMGQGRLFVFTRKLVAALQVPVSRNDWIAADNNNQPLMTIVQLNNGSVNDRSVVAVNGDLYYMSLEPSIRSLDQAVRYFNQPGNRNLSANENRILQFNDREVMQATSGIYFDNRLLMSVLPRQEPQGIVHDQVVPLDFIPISTFGADRQPNWEGSYQAMPVFQMLVGDFGGRERAFAAVRSETGDIETWEITRVGRFDFEEEAKDSHRIVYQIESPAWTWRETLGELELKELTGAEIWVDRLFGTVEFDLDYRPDGSSCWFDWHQWKICSPQNQNETLGLPELYPVPFGECFKRMSLPKPPVTCGPCGTGRPAFIGYQFQSRLTVKGFCRLRGTYLWAKGDVQGQYPSTQFVC